MKLDMMLMAFAIGVFIIFASESGVSLNLKEK